MGILNFIDKVKRYFHFGKFEIRDFFLTILAFAFIFSFTEWGHVTPSVQIGLKNYFVSFIIVGISFFIHHAAQKIMAIHLGHEAEEKFMWKTLLICLLIVFLFNGKVMLFVASSVIISVLPYHRLGKATRGPDRMHYAIVALAGPLANVIFAAIVIALSSSVIANKIFTFNLLFAAYNLLPIPFLDGSHVFYASKLLYAFVFGFVLGYILLSYIAGFYALILALLVGVIFWFVLYFFYEKEHTAPH